MNIHSGMKKIKIVYDNEEIILKLKMEIINLINL